MKRVKKPPPRPVKRSPKLRVGDRVRVLAIPGEGIAGFVLHKSTRRLCERLITKRIWLRVRRIDEHGSAWIEHRFKDAAGSWEYHSLALSKEDCWERAERDQTPRRLSKPQTGR